jgi:nitrogen fixation/metabolism regulation signal transduction histidine kinase
VAVGRRLASNFTRPLMQLVAGTRRIAAGAPSLDLAPTELELALLVEAIDEMARKIADARERLVREKQVSERMVENITSGVVSLDQERRVLMHNRVAAELLGTTVGGNLEAAVAGRERLRPVADFLRTTGAEMARATVRLAAAEGGGESEWSLIWVPLPGAGEPSALLVVEDATEVLRSQRLLAWAEMARMIAHEIKNPLTPIRLGNQHLQRAKRTEDNFDATLHDTARRILSEIDRLDAIARAFSRFGSPGEEALPLEPVDLHAVASEVVQLYALGDADRGARFTLVGTTGRRVLARRDEVKEVLVNLLENARNAEARHVVVRVSTDGRGVAVEDDGHGIPPDVLPRVFEPAFSTTSSGSGLGLAIAKRLVESWGGTIALTSTAGQGTIVTIGLPPSPPER